MSTENEGTAVPPAPSAPPVPVESPATPASPARSVPQAPTPEPPAPEPPAAHQTPFADRIPDGPVGHEAAAPTASHEPGAGPPQASGQQPPAPQDPSAAPAMPPAPVQQPAAHSANPSAAGHADSGHATGPYTAHRDGSPSAAEPHSGQSGTPAGDWPPPAPPAVPAYANGGSGWGSSYQAPEPKPGGRRGGLIATVLVAALVAGGIGGGIGFWAADRSDNASSTTVSAADNPAAGKRAPGSVAGIAAKALPSVVTIDAQGGNGEGSTGTGFVYDTQGHILTNNHVVASAAEGGKLSATFSDGKKYTAEVVGRAQGYDVAVIKLRNAPSNLKPLPLADSDKVAVGDSTIAIGAPFGLSNTVTTGIVSAKDRPVTTSDEASSQASYMSALQTDASINPGNSGGPLLDARGAVIGINSAIQPSGSGGMGGAGQAGSIGLGFAIPINQARNVARQLIKTGEPVYAVIGASVSLEARGEGATITKEGVDGSKPVTPGGPADKAGLKPGDSITKLDDTVIDSGPTLIGEIWNRQPGDTVKITYKRDGKEHTAEVILGQRKGDDN